MMTEAIEGKRIDGVGVLDTGSSKGAIVIRFDDGAMLAIRQDIYYLDDEEVGLSGASVIPFDELFPTYMMSLRKADDLDIEWLEFDQKEMSAALFTSDDYTAAIDAQKQAERKEREEKDRKGREHAKENYETCNCWYCCELISADINAHDVDSDEWLAKRAEARGRTKDHYGWCRCAVCDNLKNYQEWETARREVVIEKQQ